MQEGHSNLLSIQRAIRILGICFLVGIVIYLATRKTEGISIAVNDDNLSFVHSSGDSFEINYQDILSVEETPNLDPGIHISGIETENSKFGVWENNEFSEYTLSIYNNVRRYIVIKTFAKIFVFNLESLDATDNFYKSFTELLQAKQAEAIP
jgi:hypothetical protein